MFFVSLTSSDLFSAANCKKVAHWLTCVAFYKIFLLFYLFLYAIDIYDDRHALFIPIAAHGYVLIPSTFFNLNEIKVKFLRF